MPRVNGNSPGEPRLRAKSQPSRSAGVTTGSRGSPVEEADFFSGDFCDGGRPAVESGMRLPDAPRTPKGKKREASHQDSIDHGETHEPGGWAIFPLAPSGDAAVNGKNRKQRADGLVKNLPRDAPDDAQSNEDGLPKRGQQFRRHARILTPFFGFSQRGRLTFAKSELLAALYRAKRRPKMS